MKPARGKVVAKRKLDDSGEFVELLTFTIDGREVTEAEFRKAFPEREGVPYTPAGGTWPMRSDALGCHPSQVDEVQERNKRLGIENVTYDREDGTAIVGSRAARKKLIKAEGLRDNHGGYGD